ncbi:MAG: TDP-N-acetylfucosamine:lipid II N-acetylfucosaminyltransferase [Alphaproteobacteria bacterium]|nr:TDP-N-acetylfucosamine:lipid II N-acetylfucosaminyltransferase [Alphaproteobacteria bacterium]
MRALHVISIEKFAPHIVEISETVNPGKNRHIVVGAGGDTINPLGDRVPISVRNSGFAIDDEMRGALDWCEALFIHFLSEEACTMIQAAGPETVVIWCGFGADYYSYTPRFRDRMLLPATQRLQTPSSARRLVQNAKRAPGVNLARRTFGKHGTPEEVRRIAPRIDFFCSRESDLGLATTLPGFGAVQLSNFGYYTLENVLSVGAAPIDGPDILIGNSATPSNNHLDVLEQMRGLDMTGRKIVLPLSYGDEACARAVADHALSLFGAPHLEILRDWMPIEAYNKVLDRCGIAVMNHVRGQAMGNISSMLYRGAKVYLRPENPYLELFDELGAITYLIANGPFDAAFFAPISDRDKATNERVMRDYWSISAVQQRTGRIFARVQSEAERRSAKGPR